MKKLANMVLIFLKSYNYEIELFDYYYTGFNVMLISM